MTPDAEQTIRRIVRDKALATLTTVIAIIGLLVALAHAAPTPTPTSEQSVNVQWTGKGYLLSHPTPRHHLTIHEKMQRDRIITRNLGPHDPRPAPRTNVPPTVPLQFLPGVKP